MQSSCRAWLEQKHSRGPALLASHGLPNASASSCWAAGATGALAVLAQPHCPRLSPCLCTHVSFQRDSQNTAGLDATHPYSRDAAAAGGGQFILWISPTLDIFFFAIYIFRGFTAVMAALYWLDLLKCCKMMITLCCLFVIPCWNGCGVCILIWENSSNTNPANSEK